MKGSEEVCGVSIVAGCDAPEVLDAAEHALDGVSAAVEEGREAVFPDAVGLGRDVGEGPAAADLAADGVAVVALT